MKISLNWLKKFVSIPFSADALASHLTMVGLEVEEIVKSEPSFCGIRVGRITSVKPHPDSKNLTICKVNLNSEEFNVICGAPNVKKGLMVPFAVEGSVLGNGNLVKEVIIKGIHSRGMICSEKELGVGQDHQGIMILDPEQYSEGDEFTIPKSIDQDVVLDINVTPNRPDCLSHIGIAREVGVITGTPVKKPTPVFHEDPIHTKEWIEIQIDDPIACPRYCVRVVRNVRIGTSPYWLRSILEHVGIRSINNIVDITNFILMETGHPLHAFDYDKIQGRRIVVRKAQQGESFTTLDERKHLLTADDLLICDNKRGIGLAGVMGGLNSEVSDSTKNILIESAYFEPKTIRKMAKHLGIVTEASIRFERGADPDNAPYALDIAAQMMSELAGGTVLSEMVDVYPARIPTKTLHLRIERLNHVLGAEIPYSEVIGILKKLDLEIKQENPLVITVPNFRQDLQDEIDLIEEVIRHYGFEKIPPQQKYVIPLTTIRNHEDLFVERLKDLMVGFGFIETWTNSLVSEKHVSVKISSVHPIKLQNPLSPETAFLRTSLVPSILDTIRTNHNRSQTDLRLFEIGKVYHSVNGLLPLEKLILIVALTGNIQTVPFWGRSAEPVGFFQLKGIIENLFNRFHIMKGELIPFPCQMYDSISFEIVSDSKLGFCGRINKDLMKEWDLQSDVFLFEIDVLELAKVQPKTIKFESVTRFPAIKRDLAIIVDDKVTTDELKQVIFKCGGDFLVQTELFDLYQGKQIPQGKKSMAFSMTFLSMDRTLREEEIDPVIDTIINALEKTYDAKLRS